MTFVPTATLLGDETAPKLGLLLHGALGSGNNLRSLAVKLAKLRPEYRFCLVDLRHHGESQGAPPPNTLEACAQELSALIAQLGREPDVIAGHSFGGKTALMFARLFPGRARQYWILDSNPGTQDATATNEVIRVIQAVRRTTTPAADRAHVVAELTDQGLSSGTANWLATNLQRKVEGFVWRFNLDAIYELMLDYFRVDLWGIRFGLSRSRGRAQRSLGARKSGPTRASAARQRGACPAARGAQCRSLAACRQPRLLA